jgi:allantoinase
MHWDHIVRNGKIVDGNEIFEADIYIKDGKIAAISKEALEGSTNHETDAQGCHVLPGLIDVHIHSRDPGPTYKEDFYHSTQAAAAGGITTVFEMPNTTPTINNVENFHKQVNNLTPKAFVDFGIWGICLGELNLKNIASLNDVGVIGFKFFWGYAVNSKTFQLVYNYNPDEPDIIPPFRDGEVLDIFEEVAKTGKVLAIHAENHDLMEHLSKKVEASGRRDYEALLAGRPNLAEETTIQTGIAFARKTGARLHILHITTAEGVQRVRQAQKEGLPVTAETCPHYLFLSNEDFDRVGPTMKVYPPVKYKKDQEAIWQGLDDGVVSIVCSDHAPHTAEEKNGDLWSIPAGMCGVETLVPMMLNAVNEGKLTIQRLASVLSENPAKQFGVYPQKGSLQVGTDADITIVDLNKKHKINKEELHSKSKVTAFDGLEITGFPVSTIVRGKTVMKHGEIMGEPTGRLVTPEKK